MKYKRVFIQHILDTQPETYVPLQSVFVCFLEPTLHSLLRLKKEFSVTRMYISTKSLKHGYDRRPDFTEINIDQIHDTLKCPDHICEDINVKKNDPTEKRGDFIFFKKIGRNRYMGCPVEVTEIDGGTALFCVSFFPSKKGYIKNFPSLWDREVGDMPPS